MARSVDTSIATLIAIHAPAQNHEGSTNRRAIVSASDAPRTRNSVRMLNTDREMVHRFVAAHRELTDWIHQTSEEAQRRVREELR